MAPGPGRWPSVYCPRHLSGSFSPSQGHSSPGLGRRPLLSRLSLHVVLPADLAQPTSSRAASSRPGRHVLHVPLSPGPSGVVQLLPGTSGHLTMSLSLINYSCVPHGYLGSARVPISGWSWMGSFVAAFGLGPGRGARGPEQQRTTAVQGTELKPNDSPGRKRRRRPLF